ncbi:Med5-domain-containing protein [Coleophoma cylindrospora]|uniref:Mediator of RNA polymerase II transcription subunit 5 n=1 Tax=Coleophoma cylindrospora TaxID=1849047 RepID=A0A3D8RHI8_9HELO|nr:Med5-domain-containing protein [Coleophoma cylindrospora]
MATAWTQFLSHSLATRLEPETFSSYVQILSCKHPLSKAHAAEIFLRPTSDNDVNLDPRIPRYLQVLLGLQLVDTPGILKALAKYSSFGREGEKDNVGHENPDGADKKEKTVRWRSSYAAEESLFYRLAKHISSGAAPRNTQEAVELILVSIKWMDLVSTAVHADETLGLGSHAEEMSAAIMALGTLLVAVTENGKVLNSFRGGCPKGISQTLSKCLATCIPLLLQTAPQSAARLEIFRTQTLVAVAPVDKKEQADRKEIEDIMDEAIGLGGMESLVVGDLPTMNSRPGLYIYLNSLLVAMPLMDDDAIFAYLHNRYQGDIQSTMVDLILASFDILANAIYRKESSQTTTLLRSFLINKLPLLLSPLSSSLFPPLNAEYCITGALAHVDTNVFPTLASMFDESSNSNFLSDSVRPDFCFACCLHGLIPESSIEALLGDIPMQSLPAGGRYAKEDLVQQCLSDPERAEGLIDELEHMDGNVGAVSQAITEVIGRLCTNKETMTLKALCSKLAQKPSSLDTMLLFDKPVTILQPICEVLDNWRYDDDQGEYQPVYEEFGSILLLVLAFVHRYNLSPNDLGIRNSESFVTKLLNQGHLSKAMENLTDQEQSHLDGWIRGLFDNESGGLGDELMGSCPPQDFYLLVPTLFHHIVIACSTNNLSDEGLKGGLEYLVDTFLLPSLVGAITWLSSHLWESRGNDATSVLQILSALILTPTSISSEASNIFPAILNIIAKPMEHSLRWYQRAEPSCQDIEPLSKKIKGNLGWERHGGSEHTELEAWTATPGGSMTASVRQTVQNLVQWGLNPGMPGMNIIPASYTHRQILAALKIIGAKRLLHAIISEVLSQTEAGNGSIVIDVATAIICAPCSCSEGLRAAELAVMQPLQRRMTLREALKNEADNSPKIHKSDPAQAETIVRLSRRVEAQLLQPQPVMGAMGLDDAGLQMDAALQQQIDAGVGEVDEHQQSIDAVIAGDDDLMSGLGLSMDGGDDLFGGGSDGMGF